MLNLRQKCQKFIDWRAWKWVYYFELTCFLAVATYSLGTAIFFSIYKDFSLSGKANPTDMVYIGLTVFIPCLVSALSAFFLKARIFYKVILMPAIFICLIVLEFYLINKLFIQPNMIYINS
jgi:hypothetical protein